MSPQPYSNSYEEVQILLPMMNIVASLRNRLFISVVAVLSILTVVSFAFVWPTPAVASNQGLLSAESVEKLYALNSKQNMAQDESEELSALLAKAAVLYKLRDILTKYGIPPEDNVAISLEIVDTDPAGLIKHKKQARFEGLPVGKNQLGSQTIDKSLTDAIEQDFLIPTDVMFNLNREFLKVDGIEDSSTVKKILYKLDIEFGDDTEELSRITVFAYCILCPFPVIWCAG